ncbi:MAG: sulfite exporter TauE/SafE family protein, partial [Bryobacteraceae bacterium]
MNALEFSLLAAAGSMLAGMLGSLTGLGGGVVIVPLLTLVFHVDLRYAAGASLVSVIATSSGAASAFVREGYSNIRVAMLLEIATSAGALGGAFLATRLRPSSIAIVFGVLLLFSAVQAFRHQEHDFSPSKKADPLAQRLRLDSTYPGPDGECQYHVYRVPLGFGLMFGAGTRSGLLGIGSGALKVLAMDRAMRLPFKVSTTTSNFMIGVTAAASAGIYFSRGYIDPGLSMPVVLGVLAGSFLGAKLLMRARVPVLRALFALVIFVLGVEMI